MLAAETRLWQNRNGARHASTDTEKGKTMHRGIRATGAGRCSPSMDHIKDVNGRWHTQVQNGSCGLAKETRCAPGDWGAGGVVCPMMVIKLLTDSDLRGAVAEK